MLAVDGLSRTYGAVDAAVTALLEVTLAVDRGELVAVRGRSGSGKSTLLGLIGGLDRPDAGTVRVAGQQVTSMDEAALRVLRRDTLGYVFQNFALIPTLTAAENIGIPLRLQRKEPAERERRVELLLALVGLEGHGSQRPSELSGGQQQRVALARALACDPPLLLADEPTGQLDSQTGHEVMELVRAVVRSEGTSVLVSTHDAQVLDVADRVLEIVDGRVSG
jgi:putative ABC transport system ATP-binding protein